MNSCNKKISLIVLHDLELVCVYCSWIIIIVENRVYLFCVDVVSSPATILCLQACGQIGRLLKIQHDGDMVVKVGGQQIVISPTCVNPVFDPELARKAPPVPTSDSEDESGGEEGAALEPEGDSVPGRRVVSNPDDVKDKQNLKGRFTLILYAIFKIRLTCFCNIFPWIV